MSIFMFYIINKSLINIIIRERERACSFIVRIIGFIHITNLSLIKKNYNRAIKVYEILKFFQRKLNKNHSILLSRLPPRVNHHRSKTLRQQSRLFCWTLPFCTQVVVRHSYYLAWLYYIIIHLYFLRRTLPE